jgi:uncharacterized protein (TIGR02246 family)
MHIVRPATIAVLVVLAACAPPPGPAELSAEDLDAIESVTAAWSEAFDARDWDGLAATYTEDALLLPPNSPAVEGREAIKAFFAGFPTVDSLDLEIVEIDGRGDLAYVRGVYRMTIPSEGEAIVDTGKYIEIRRRDADGAWRLHLDIFNSDNPAVE